MRPKKRMSPKNAKVFKQIRKERLIQRTFNEKLFDSVVDFSNFLWKILSSPYFLIGILVVLSLSAVLASRARATSSGSRASLGKAPSITPPSLDLADNCRSLSKPLNYTQIQEDLIQAWTRMQIDTPVLNPLAERWLETNSPRFHVMCNPLSPSFMEAGYHRDNYISFSSLILNSGKLKPLLREELFHAASNAKYHSGVKPYHTEEMKKNYLDATLKSMARLTYLINKSSPLDNEFTHIEPDYREKVIKLIEQIDIYLPLSPVNKEVRKGQKLKNNPSFGFPVLITEVHDKKMAPNGKSACLVTAKAIGNAEERLNAIGMIYQHKLERLKQYYHREHGITDGTPEYYGELGSFFVGELFENEEFAETLLPEFYHYIKTAFEPEQTWYHSLLDYIPSWLYSSNRPKLEL